MKRLCIIGLMLLSIRAGMSQFIEKLDFNLVLAPGVTIASIKDNWQAPSRESLAADGYTFVDENGLKGSMIKLGVNYNIDDTWALSTGLFFSEVRLNPRNQDGSYIGTSVYHVNYMSIPFMLRYRSNELTDNLRIVGSLGPALDIKTKERVQGADYAHYMNFAHNRYDIDPGRGRNGNNKRMNLFGTFGASVLASVDVEYMLGESFYLLGGLTYQYRLNNLLNGRLLYNDEAQTPVTEHLSFKASTLAFDFGVGYRIP